MHTPDEYWINIKEVYSGLAIQGYTFDVAVDRCVVYRFEEPIFGMRNLNDPTELDESKGRLAHWSAALGAASAHLRFNPNQTPRAYPGMDS